MIHRTYRAKEQKTRHRKPVAPVGGITRGQARALGTFPLRLVGDRLAPRYRDGDVLLVDTRREALPGHVVIVELASKNGPPGAYRAGLWAFRMNSDRDLWDYQGGHVAAGEWRLVGVVTGRLPAR